MYKCVCVCIYIYQLLNADRYSFTSLNFTIILTTNYDDDTTVNNVTRLNFIY